MLSIEKCKTILVDDNETYTDEEIKTIREHLYKMATTVKKHRKIINVNYNEKG